MINVLLLWGLPIFLAGIAIVSVIFTLSRTWQVVLIVFSVILAAGTIWKGFIDDRDKEALIAFVECGTRPPGTGYNAMSNEVKDTLKRILKPNDENFNPDANYSYIDDGVVFNFVDAENNQRRFSFDGCGRGELYRDVLRKEGTEKFIKNALNETFILDPDPEKYDDDIYHRIEVVLENAILKSTRFEPLNDSYDERGFRAVIFPQKIVEVPLAELIPIYQKQKNFSLALPEIEKVFYGEIAKQTGQSSK
jgi:hypothetical protein